MSMGCVRGGHSAIDGGTIGRLVRQLIGPASRIVIFDVYENTTGCFPKMQSQCWAKVCPCRSPSVTSQADGRDCFERCSPRCVLRRRTTRPHGDQREAVENNVWAPEWCAVCLKGARLPSLHLVLTDKAVNPTNA